MLIVKKLNVKLRTTSLGQSYSDLGIFVKFLITYVIRYRPYFLLLPLYENVSKITV